VTPVALGIDERLSWARRDGDSVSIHLSFVGRVLEPGPAVVELVSPSGRLRSSAVVTTIEDGTVADVAVPQSELGRSTWRLGIQASGDTRFVAVDARLLAAPTLPVALLPGPAPTTRMPPPTPRTRRPWPLRLAARLPAPVKQALRHARTRGRGLSRRAS
jgi:hypothetical protein